MKRALGILVVGILGVALAFLVIPVALPTVESPPATDRMGSPHSGRSTPADEPEPDPVPARGAEVRDEPRDPAGESAGERPEESLAKGSEDHPRDREPNPNPLAEGRKELYQLPEIRTLREVKPKWARIRQILQAGDAPGTEYTLETLDTLLADFATVTQQQDFEAFDELVGRQQTLLRDLRQLQSYDGEMEELSRVIGDVLSEGMDER